MATFNEDAKKNLMVEGGTGNDSIQIRNRYDQEGDLDGVTVETFDEQGKLLQHRAYTATELEASHGLEIYGGEGNDSIDARGVAYNLFIDGGAGNDELTGGDAYNAMSGGDGSDTMTGGRGDDFMYGGDGNDLMYGLTGNDILYGQGGNDSLFGNQGADSVSGGDGADYIIGDPAKDLYLDPGTEKGDRLEVADE